MMVGLLVAWGFIGAGLIGFAEAISNIRKRRTLQEHRAQVMLWEAHRFAATAKAVRNA